MATRAVENRQITKFEYCKKHDPWFAFETRARTAEVFVEGGFASAGHCEGGKCRLWPGRYFYVAEICNGEFELDWTTPNA